MYAVQIGSAAITRQYTYQVSAAITTQVSYMMVQAFENYWVVEYTDIQTGWRSHKPTLSKHTKKVY
jgi:hypothetical protein